MKRDGLVYVNIALEKAVLLASSAGWLTSLVVKINKVVKINIDFRNFCY